MNTLHTAAELEAYAKGLSKAHNILSEAVIQEGSSAGAHRASASIRELVRLVHVRMGGVMAAGRADVVQANRTRE